MISREHQCIYIHTRKTAGCSIMAAFGLLKKGPDSRAFNNGPLGSDWYKRPRGYFVFSSVRNPFDRVVSGWRWSESLRDMPLERCLELLPRDGQDYSHFTRTQIRALRNKRGKIVADDLIRFESLQADFDRICDKIGKPRAQLDHLNATDHPHYREVVTPRARKIIERVFAEDFEAFGYEW